MDCRYSIHQYCFDQTLRKLGLSNHGFSLCTPQAFLLTQLKFLKIGNFDTDKKVLIIAEIGNNHEGDFELAKEMIDAAAEAGADAVKFQTFRTEHYINKLEKQRFSRLKSF